MEKRETRPLSTRLSKLGDGFVTDTIIVMICSAGCYSVYPRLRLTLNIPQVSSLIPITVF